MTKKGFLGDFNPIWACEKSIQLMTSLKGAIARNTEAKEKLLKDAEKVEFTETKRIILDAVDEIELDIESAKKTLKYVEEQAAYYKEKLEVEE